MSNLTSLREVLFHSENSNVGAVSTSIPRAFRVEPLIKQRQAILYPHVMRAAYARQVSMVSEWLNWTRPKRIEPSALRAKRSASSPFSFGNGPAFITLPFYIQTPCIITILFDFAMQEKISENPQKLSGLRYSSGSPATGLPLDIITPCGGRYIQGYYAGVNGIGNMVPTNLQSQPTWYGSPATTQAGIRIPTHVGLMVCAT